MEKAKSLGENLMRESCAFLRSFWCGLLVFAGSSLFVSPTKADTVTIYDSTDSLTAVTVGTNRSFTSSCGTNNAGVEICTFSLTSLNGATIKSTIGGGQPVVVIAEPGGAFVSDTFTFEGVTAGNSSFTGAFISDSDTLVPQSCEPIAPCTITENGGIQTALTVGWSDGTQDVIRFQSDVPAPVPEPPSLLLTLAGLALVGLYIHRLRG